jgi:hypothetical protein
MSKLILQVITAVIGLLTLGLGAVQLIFGIRSPMYAQVSLPDFPILDSNLRFFGGLGVGLGIILIWSIFRIEDQTILFRVAWGLGFLGGVGRLVSFFGVGSPSPLLTAFTILEVIGAPIFVYWQSRLAG